MKKLEKDIQKEICEWLQGKGYFFWKHNTFPRFQDGRKFAYPKYTPKGLPDIMIVYKGHFIGLEVKVPDYWKYTDSQKEIKEKMIENGASYHLVVSLEETKDIMKVYDDGFYSKDEEIISDFPLEEDETLQLPPI